MSKYDPLWNWIKDNRNESFQLSFEEAETILGFPFDHSFLKFKTELTVHGFNVGKISLKEKIINFEKI